MTFSVFSPPLYFFRCACVCDVCVPIATRRNGRGLRQCQSSARSPRTVKRLVFFFFFFRVLFPAPEWCSCGRHHKRRIILRWHSTTFGGLPWRPTFEILHAAFPWSTKSQHHFSTPNVEKIRRFRPTVLYSCRRGFHTRPLVVEGPPSSIKFQDLFIPKITSPGLRTTVFCFFSPPCRATGPDDGRREAAGGGDRFSQDDGGAGASGKQGGDAAGGRRPRQVSMADGGPVVADSRVFGRSPV